jgi:hypothetical protein
MDQIPLDFYRLSQETFELAKTLKACDQDLIYGDSSNDPSGDAIPQTPGVFYRLEKNPGTFCIKIYPTQNLALTYQEDAHLVAETLRAPIEEAAFYQTPNLGIAEILCDQIGKKRFPFEEELVCKISDPGFSWWFKKTTDGFIVSFGAHRGEKEDGRFPVGPLGDRAIANAMMIRLKDFLNPFIDRNRTQFSDGHLSWSFKTGGAGLRKTLEKLFLQGVESDLASYIPYTSEGRTLMLYLRELAHIRKFWIEIELGLDDKKLS